MTQEIEVRPEDRVAERRALCAEARLLLEVEDAFVAGIVTDLSVHGLWVATDRVRPLGSQLVVEFAPAPGFPQISLRAFVARIDAHADEAARTGMGLSFVELGASERRVLEDALAGLPPRPVRSCAPVIALVEHDLLEDEVEQILDEDDLVTFEESGLFAIVVEGGRDDEFVPLADAELEIFDVG